MASASPLKDIDEQFLQCCICMEQLKEPKMLPCLHHYCRDCLKTVFKEKTEIECPTCREVHTLPKGGIDGLKTDFNTKNIVEFIQLQNSIEVDPQRTCIHCRKKLKASAFCFKCNDFLCGSCHEFHAASPMVEDHHPHIFSLSEAEARNLTIQNLSSLKVAPRCHTHPRKLSELCCTTCGNQPICMPCSYGAHQGHNLKEVTSLARIEREKLTGKIAEMMQHKDEIYKRQGEIQKTRKNIVQKTDKMKRKLQEQLAAEEEEIRREIRDTDKELKKKQAELKERLKKKTTTRKQELEDKMREAREEYERVCQRERQEADAELHKLQQQTKREKEKLQKGLDMMNTNIQDLLTSLKTQEEENTERIRGLSDHFDDIVKRFETVTRTASSILAAENDWADVQCIPDICRAVDVLREDMKKDHQETISSMRIRRKVDISKAEESVVDIKYNGIAEWEINSITSNAVGSIVISGRASTGKKSHIMVINMKGDHVKHQIFQTMLGSWRYCGFLSQFQIASVCANGEIGLYDIRDSSHRKINIKDATSISPWILNVTTNPAIGNFIVSSHSKDLFVFSSQLEYMKKLSLPEEVISVRDLVLHRGYLLVCDYEGRRAFAVTMAESESQIKYEFNKPDLDGRDWVPRSVCTDQEGCIYMVWLERQTVDCKILLVQYRQDGGQIQSVRQVAPSHHTQCITAVKTPNGEKILLPTYKTGQLITYHLK